MSSLSLNKKVISSLDSQVLRGGSSAAPSVICTLNPECIGSGLTTNCGGPVGTLGCAE